MAVSSYRDMDVWRKAMDFVVLCYQIAKRLPSSELYGLTSQLQRAAVSVPANIAEGHGRSHTKEFLRHLSIAYGSLMEVETHLLIAARLNFIDEASTQTALRQSAEIGRMLNGLRNSLNRNLENDHRENTS
jgi:four helix bundle protein